MKSSVALNLKQAGQHSCSRNGGKHTVISSLRAFPIPFTLPPALHPVPQLWTMPSLGAAGSGGALMDSLLAAPPVAQIAPQSRNILELDSTISVGGHRGMGANVIRNGNLTPAWRENTLRSFQAAAASGAAFIEFDVQVTADGVPVVWHDNLVEYGDPAHPTQCAVSDLTAAEFQALGSLSASGKCQKLSVVRRFKHAGPQNTAPSIQAALTTDAAITQRQRWCCEADDSFPTLEQLFTNLPPHLAFNIEVKMATPDDLAVTPAAEISRMVQPILEVVNRCNGTGSSCRQVVFSCFDPDVCRALRAEQEQHPVLFLSTGGRDWHADARRMSIAAAVEEAISARLSGVVVDSGALRASPDAAGLAVSHGLKLLTYGLENDSAEWVMRQRQLGVTGVIVDDLQGLMAVLTQAREGAEVAAGFMGQVAAAAAASAALGPQAPNMPATPVMSAVMAS